MHFKEPTKSIKEHFEELLKPLAETKIQFKEPIKLSKEHLEESLELRT